jgi:hypothetical protein
LQFMLYICSQFLPLQVYKLVLLDLPGLLFFSTYTLLVLFWAEIYHQVPAILTSSRNPSEPYVDHPNCRLGASQQIS